MLYQDTLTGMVHEAPDNQVSGWGLAEDPSSVGEPQVIYDGLGNPLGWGFLKRLVKKAMPFATSMLGPYGIALRQALPVFSKALAEPELAGLPVTYPRPPFYPRVQMRQHFPAGAPAPRPVPPGWMRPHLPYTGPRPRRLYLRCSAWPGPRGLVPINPGQPAALTPPAAVMAQPAMAPPPVHRRHRGGRRR